MNKVHKAHRDNLAREENKDPRVIRATKVIKAILVHQVRKERLVKLDHKVL